MPILHKKRRKQLLWFMERSFTTIYSTLSRISQYSRTIAIFLLLALLATTICIALPPSLPFLTANILFSAALGPVLAPLIIGFLALICSALALHMIFSVTHFFLEKDRKKAALTMRKKDIHPSRTPTLGNREHIANHSSLTKVLVTTTSSMLSYPLKNITTNRTYILPKNPFNRKEMQKRLTPAEAIEQWKKDSPILTHFLGNLRYQVRTYYVKSAHQERTSLLTEAANSLTACKIALTTRYHPDRFSSHTETDSKTREKIQQYFQDMLSQKLFTCQKETLYHALLSNDDTWDNMISVLTLSFNQVMDSYEKMQFLWKDIAEKAQKVTEKAAATAVITNSTIAKTYSIIEGMDQVLADYGKLGISFDKIHCSQQQQTAKLINYETRMAKIEQRQQQQVTTTLDLEQTAKELHAKMDACLATLFA